MNWKAAVDVSNPVYSGIDAPNTTTAVASAIQRPALMPRSPTNNTTRPPAMGSQVRSESKPNCMGSRFLLMQVGNEPAEHDGESDDHPESVGIQEAALHAARDAREPADEARRPVDDGSVDDRGIAALPEDRA